MKAFLGTAVIFVGVAIVIMGVMIRLVIPFLGVLFDRYCTWVDRKSDR